MFSDFVAVTETRVVVDLYYLFLFSLSLLLLLWKNLEIFGVAKFSELPRPANRAKALTGSNAQ
jgi:hypothetical protein